MLSLRMEKFIITVILLICGDTLLTTGFPQWVSDQDTTLSISMASDTTCTQGIAEISAASDSSQSVTYASDNANFPVNLDTNTYTNKLYCNYSALQAVSTSVFTVVVTASDPGGAITRTFTLTLIDRYAPDFDQNTVSFTNCDLSGYAAGDILYTVVVTDDDPGDTVTIAITSSNTPFIVTQETKITFADNTTLVQWFIDTTFPYTLNVQATDTGSVHTTDGTIQVSYSSGEDCGGSNGGNSGDDDESGCKVLGCSVYIVSFFVLIIRLIHNL